MPDIKISPKKVLDETTKCHLWTKLIECIVCKYEFVPKLADATKKVVSPRQLFGSTFRTIDAASKTFHVVTQPRNKFFPREAIRIFTHDWHSDGTKRHLASCA